MEVDVRDDRTVRWGVLGTGWVAQRFMADLAAVDGARLAAVGSSSGRAAALAGRFGAARAHDSPEALVNDGDVDVVYVATEPHLHDEHSLLALRAGKHVLCEKPFALGLERAARVLDAARERGLFCMEAMWTRFLPAVLEAKRRVDAGEIGDPRLFTADFGAPVVSSEGSRFLDRARGGGALLDRGVYGVSLAVWLFGKPIQVLAAAQRRPGGVDETISAVLRFHEDRLAVITASISAYSGNEAVIAGTRGRVRLGEPMCRPDRVTLSRAAVHDAGARPDLAPWSAKERARRLLGRVKPHVPLDALRGTSLSRAVTGYGYAHEAAEVVRCLREGLTESPLMPLAETRIVAGVMDDILGQLA
jgi:predicted dehydrogenase